MSKLSKQEERELLELEIERARLKLATGELLRKRQQQQRQQDEHFGHKLIELAGQASQKKLTWSAVMMPARWKHRVLVGIALLAWEYWRKQQNHSYRSYR